MSMRRHTVAVAIIAAVLMHGPDVARATVRRTHHSTVTTTPAPPAPPITITVPGAAAGAPATTALHPGSSTSLHVTVANTSSSDRLDVSISTVDAVLQPDGTIVPGTTGGAAMGSGASSWLGLGDTVVELQPGATIDVPVSISVPAEAAGGATAAVIRATITHAAPLDTPPTQKDLALTGEAATVGVRIDVQAPVRPELNVRTVTVTRDHAKRTIRVTIANIGSSAASVSGSLAVGTPPVTVPISANVPAHGEKTVSAAWPKSLPTNKAVDATVTVHHGDDNAQWSGTVDPTAKARPKPQAATSDAGAAPSSGGGGLGVPWWVIGAIALAVAWLGYELFAANRARGGVTTPLAGITTMPLVDPTATARLHDELEPLVAAITALAESMQPGGRGHVSEREWPPPAIDQLDEYDEVGLHQEINAIADLEEVDEVDELPEIDATDPLDAVPWVDEIEPGEPEVIEEPVAPARADDAALVFASTTAMADAAEPLAAEPVTDAVATLQELQELRPWEPQLVVEQIRTVLDQISPSNATTAALDEPEVIAVLTPDELVEAVASALTVAPDTVRHWLSNETIEAATRATVMPGDVERIVRERQVLAAQVE
ncbi:MAG TPA: hypothetical protein VGI86_08125, partial [Acidimicrobiia bacterium]